MGKSYQKRTKKAARKETQKIREFFAGHGQLFVPFLELIQSASFQVSEVLDEAVHGVIEALLEASATMVAGPRHQGRRGGPIRRHAHQDGVIALADRKLRVKRPRLRHRENGEVEIPAYTRLQEDAAFGAHVEEVLMKGVSTRDYEGVLTELSESVGISKSSVSREFIEASKKSLELLRSRRWGWIARARSTCWG